MKNHILRVPMHLRDHLFIHKYTKTKMEMAFFVKNQSNRSTYEKLIERLKNEKGVALAEDLEKLSKDQQHLHMFRVYRLWNTDGTARSEKYSEGYKGFFGTYPNMHLIRSYWCVWVNHYKIEMTIALHSNKSSVLCRELQIAVQRTIRITKDISDSLLPWTFQGGCDIESIESFCKKRGISVDFF